MQDQHAQIAVLQQPGEPPARAVAARSAFTMPVRTAAHEAPRAVVFAVFVSVKKSHLSVSSLFDCV
jgi:hypothetical protein